MAEAKEILPVDVCLVQVPFAAVSRPSLGLGLVKSHLERAGLSAQVEYSSFAFAERVGLDVYGLIEISSPDVLFGEWIFSRAAFPERATPDREADDERFLDSLEHSVFASETARWLRLCYPRLDLKRLAASVREQAELFLDDLAEALLARRPKMVGCTSMFQQHCAALALLRRIKDRDPGIVTLLGGPNCEGTMGLTTHQAFPWVDFVFSGETDAYIGDLCRDLLREGIELEASRLPTGVWGPAHRLGDADSAPSEAPASTAAVSGHLVSLGASRDPDAYSGVVHDLDLIPPPDYEDYFARLGSSDLAPFIGPALPLESSRGCWWGEKQHCTFCGLNGMGMVYRSKSPEAVLAEIRDLCDRHRVREVEFADNILGMESLKTLIPALAAAGNGGGGGNGSHLFFEIKANLSREHLRALSAAGVRWIQPGIESLHPEILERLKKGVSPLHNVQLLRWARQLGTHVYYTLLYGLPDDRDAWYADLAEWIPQLAHLQPPFASSRIRFDRFSPYHRDAPAFELDLSPKRQYGYVYPVPKRDLAGLAYYFEDYSRTTRGVVSGQAGEARPGLRAFLDAVTTWRHQWFDPRRAEPPTLTLEDDGQALTVTDRRPRAAGSGTVVLDGLDRELYLLCDQIRSAATLRRRSAARGAGASRGLEERLADLVGRGLLLESGDRFLALALAGECRPYPTIQGAPLAKVDYLEYFRTTGRRPFVLRSCAN
ncbi:MAG: RiPP maturation radical SAM C-methyltransferase [Holophagales bacterium]|nr:RiPP maturation radical SAM C-methyltransferase [Holophagales bacterium]